jgi:hypothetical protein
MWAERHGLPLGGETWPARYFDRPKKIKDFKVEQTFEFTDNLGEHHLVSVGVVPTNGVFLSLTLGGKLVEVSVWMPPEDDDGSYEYPVVLEIDQDGARTLTNLK